ncbi:hypothetical protein ANCCAN_08244 [Ancylostoma caninum]|uniref:Uncharacterized protein n=1 Tax=Ancylostoma caninum TaxID=29170 RepID=A0A368GN40_ANCCA|nr:hypothetical protein ANCCAN_08244 [Ancylostoma caninum]
MLYFRGFILSNKSKLRRPQLSWKEAHILFGRKVILSRIDAPDYSRKRRRSPNVSAQWEFTDHLFVEDFVNLFLELSPEILYLKCKDLDRHISEILRICVGNLSAKTLAIEMDKCSLDEDALRCLLRYFEPFSLHLTGHFDRSILSDKVLPLSCLFSVFIGVNRADLETRTKISGITVRKIVNNWFRSTSLCENYDLKDFLIVLPDCDLDYNEFFAFFKELICVPHQTAERITIFNLPKTLVHTIASYVLVRVVCRNVSTFDEIGPALWVEQGLCSHDDIKWTCVLTCECHPDHIVHPAYNLGNELPVDSSRICETIRLHLGISVSKRQEMLKPKETLLKVWITLEAGLSSMEASIPETRIFDCSRAQKRRRKDS